MEKRGLRKKDILRMDGLLPPTRRLPVCDAVSSTPEKKKDRKWSIGGILRRISSIRDYESSSNDEEIVYKKVPRKSRFGKRPDGVVLHSLENNSEHDKRPRAESTVRQSADSPHSYRDSLHSRSSDGSLDGPGRKSRRSKLKARAAAKRDHLRADSSSDEDCRRSNGSLNRSYGCAETQNGPKVNACGNRKTRAARTERYIKRLSRDDGSSDTLSDLLLNKRCPTEYIEDKERGSVHIDNGLCRPPVHPRRFAGSYSTDDHAFPRESPAESPRQASRAAPPADPEVYSDLRRYSIGQCVTDLNQNTYGKISRSAARTACADNYRAGSFFTYPAKHSWHHSESYDCVADRRSIDADSRPPEPPPRDPRYRAFNYGYSSYPARRQQQYAPGSFKHDDRTNVTNGMSILDGGDFRPRGANGEDAWRNAAARRDPTLTPKTDFRNSLERINNQYNSSWHGAKNAEEAEATRCRNTRNNQLNSYGGTYAAHKAKNNSTNICKSSKQCETISARAFDWPARGSPCEQRVSRSATPTMTTTCTENRIERSKQEDTRRWTPSEETLERRRSSKNLEEALSELEAIYNSLRLGDEDLLDRAERRSMEEFSQKQGRSELAPAPADDSPDRTTDDMAYRRMHPKERPTSLSDIAGQSALSNISYLIASPVLARRDSADDLTRLSELSAPSYPSRRNEPDVTRDDVVFRSISRANNTLRVIDPQPPFGIPLGPVTAATESDYLHTTPTRSEQPRSPYIPQCEPDVVTDDLAYRTLRKDAGAARSPTEGWIGATRERPVDVARKKRAVRSLSASLYGLINHDRIHLRREPSLGAIEDEVIRDAAAGHFAATPPERPEYHHSLRRVVSDGELSDTDARRRKEPTLGRDTDINGNHPMVGAYRKPCAYSLLGTTQQGGPKKEKPSSAAEPSDAALSSSAALNDDFWHEYLRSDSNIPAANSDTAETDFSAYSRLCQDLVNLIKSDEDTAPPVDKSDDVEREVDEPASARTSARFLDSRYSEYQRAARASDERRVADENAESPIPSSIANSTEPASESSQPAGNLDFYLRVADENVRVIAEAFSSVADRLRDSHFLSVPRNNNSSSHGSETETHSPRSTLYSQDEQTNDEQRLVVSPGLGEAAAREKRNSTTSNEGDQGEGHREDVSTADVELDLSAAVRNLQLAAASLCEHEPEIESLRVRRAGGIDVTPLASADETEGDNSPMRKIGLIADALRASQEQERDQEETPATPSGVETRSDVVSRGEEYREGGERHAEVCELGRTKSQLECGVRAPCVTNIITVTITTYSMLLLACLLALLVAIVVAS